MAETKTQDAGAPAAAAPNAATAVDKTTELSGEVIQSVEDAQRAAIDAVRKFVDAVDHTLPALPHGEGPSRRQEIIDSALEMADRMVHTQNEYLRRIVDSAGKTLSRSDSEK